MNINIFFNSLEYFKDEYLPKNTYPKNAIFSNTYKDLNYILSKKLTGKDDKKYLVFYTRLGKLDYLGIDKELAYIKKLNDIKIIIPLSERKKLSLYIYIGLKFYDKLCRQNKNRINIELVTSLLPLYFIYSEFRSPNKFRPTLLLSAFENNPLKKDIYVAQFEYFIKKYVMFILSSVNSDIKNLEYVTISNEEFKQTLASEVITFNSNLLKNSDISLTDKDYTFLKHALKQMILFPLT